MRVDKRGDRELRPLKIIRNWTKYAEGSVLIEMGDTRVLCNASVEDKVPPFLKGTGQGWVTAEYQMLPRATGTRNQRDVSKGKLNGRATEIQRLIGRSLRSTLDLTALGERTITLDCDVLQADGGTRTVSILGAFIALYDACKYLMNEGMIETYPMTSWVAAISCGIVEGKELLDLCYEEDSVCQMDMNVVMSEDGKIIEVQSTAEGYPVERQKFLKLLDLAGEGIQNLIAQIKEEIK